ncbi:thiamine-binding protein [Tuberibacillus sp. Marseille-P3662]|uniref:thiamine-binding protein n=1 Tax=Tuberibacillus sp. Marseille-P3662 TaxID=1965358 RepID=UPI000A1CD93F|nr:thiamine-binding protein [Tuberibacillus sp. Marseille-P3662]
MGQANLALQVIPKVNTDDVYNIVDQAIAVIQASGVKYEVGPMETVMEGELDELIEIAKQAQQKVLDAGASEVITNIKIHYRPEGVTMDEKTHQYRA